MTPGPWQRSCISVGAEARDRKMPAWKVPSAASVDQTTTPSREHDWDQPGASRPTSMTCPFSSGFVSPRQRPFSETFNTARAAFQSRPDSLVLQVALAPFLMVYRMLERRSVPLHFSD